MNTKSLFLAALVMVSASGAFAGKDEPGNTGLAVVAMKGGETFKVIYKGETAGNVKVNVYNSNSTLVHSQSIRGTDGFILPLNFAGLNSGEYAIEVIDAGGKRIEKVAYQSNKRIRSIHLARINSAENKFLLSIANSGNQYVTLKIFNSENTLIHAESTSINGDFAKVYKLGVASRSYTFEVTDADGNVKTVKF